jgi:hypothetical protein
MVWGLHAAGGFDLGEDPGGGAGVNVFDLADPL